MSGLGAAREGPVPRVLIIEDEDEMAARLAEGLSDAGWEVERVHDGECGLERAVGGPFDVLVVDRMLPRLDGLSMVTQLRARDVGTPVLFLTAMGAVADRVAGLEAGGDDYLVKPFAFDELSARLNALARRARSRERTVLCAGGLTLDRLARTVRREGAEVELLPLEFKLLEYLMLNAGKVVTRAMLLEQVWGFAFDPRTNIVETHLSRLRGKIDPPGGPSLITTVRGSGYVVGAN
jgi:two-component system, OmpR family, response regulator